MKHRKAKMKKIYVLIGSAIPTLVFFIVGCRDNSNLNSQVNQSSVNMVKVDKSRVANNPYNDLRNQALTVTPEQLQLNLTNDKIRVYGVILDWDVGEGTVTLVAFQTGDASYYLSTGGGIIGGSGHENVKKATIAFVNKAQSLLPRAAPTETTPLPDTDSVRFYFLTNKGKFTLTEEIKNFENESSELYDLFNEANIVMTALRLTTEKQ